MKPNINTNYEPDTEFGNNRGKSNSRKNKQTLIIDSKKAASLMSG